MDDPTMQQQADPAMMETESSGDLVIKITCKQDGTFGIDTETSEPEAPAMEGAAQVEAGQSAGSAKECLQIVLDLIKNKGQAAGADEQAGFDAAMGQQ